MKFQPAEYVFLHRITNRRTFFKSDHFFISPVVPDNWAYVYIDSRKDALHGSEYTLLCTVMAINGMTLPPSIVWVGPDGTVLVSEENVTVGEVETQGTVSTSSLTFNPVLSSQGGRYTCIVTVDVPWMLDQPDQLFDTFNMLVTSELSTFRY